MPHKNDDLQVIEEELKNETNQFRKARLQKLKALIESGVAPYPSTFQRSHAIADVLEKKRHRKTGPKKNEIKKFRNLFLKVQVEHWKEVHKRAKRRGIKIRGGAYEVARERVSKRTGLSEGTIDKICYPRNKKRINAQ